MAQLVISPEQASELPALVDRAVSATIVLEPGEYRLPLLHIGQAVRLVGREGAARTILRPLQGSLLKVFGGAAASELSGLTLTAGEADGGGAIELHNDARLRLSDCVFESNQAEVFRGGAVHALAETTLTVERSIFRANRCARGGALALADGAKARIDRCVFVDNEAELGGAVWVSDEADLTLASCTFVGNVATHERGGSAVFVTATATVGPRVRLVNALLAGRRAVVNNVERPGRLSVGHCLLPPDTLATPGLDDAGGNLELQADMIEVAPGLWALRPGAAGAAAADISEIANGACDLLGRPLVTDGHADPGALAAPAAETQSVGQYTSIDGN